MTREEALQILDTIPTIGEQVDALEMAIQALSQEQKSGWNNHQIACMLADLFGDVCACNYNGIDEWLPELCAFKDTCCPKPIGVACWEQFLKYIKSKYCDCEEPCDDTVSIRKDVLKCRVGKLVVYNVEWLKKHWQMEMDIVCGLKPCDDAISRDAVIKLFNGNIGSEAALILHMVKQLPSFTQKSGKWLMTGEVDVYYDLPSYECSKCGQSSLENGDYCPNCGAKMESEDKE